LKLLLGLLLKVLLALLVILLMSVVGYLTASLLDNSPAE